MLPKFDIVPSEFAAWAAGQTGRYNFCNPTECPLCRYLRFLGARDVSVNSYSYRVGGERTEFTEEVLALSRTIVPYWSYEQLNLALGRGT